MAKVFIHANSNGFFNFSPLGEALAPNVFLNTDVNINGTIHSSEFGWETAERALYPDFGINIIANNSNLAVEKLGSQTEIEVSQIEYFRVIEGEYVVFGKLELPSPIKTTATYDQISENTNGWTADIGDNLEKVIQNDGYVFIGSDVPDFFAPHSTIFPTYANNVIRGRGGDDVLNGSLGNDKIMGGSGNDQIFDPDGENFLNGQSGDDTIILGDGSDQSVAKGGHGNDALISGNGSDTLRGGLGNDELYGGKGEDVLFGGRGDDILTGGRGNDILKGNLGADQFIFNAEEDGSDVIKDFSDGLDILVIQNANQMADLAIEQQGADTFIDFGGGNELLLNSFDADLLDTSDFLFI